MATTTRTGRASSFSRSPSTFSSSSSASPLLQQHSGLKLGPNAAAFVSSGLPDLDRILGGGFRLGSLVMVMEDADCPHHLSLLSNFMSQGVVHRQPLLFASPSKESAQLYSPVSLSSKDDKQEGELKIAFQYRKYAQQPVNSDIKQDFSNDFDLKKPLSGESVISQSVEFVTIENSPNLTVLHDRCSSFLSKLPRNDGSNAGRIAIQSLCAPQCGYFELDWDMVSFIRSLRAMIRSSNAVAVITFPNSLLSHSFSKRWQHLADTLLSVRAIPDEDKDLEKLLTGYEDMVGFLHVHKVVQINSQVPTILEASTYSLKVKRRSRCKWLVLERLNQAPVDGSSGPSNESGGSCSRGSSLDF